ncbi:MAG: aldehyde dehydrogenase [Bacteroidetes bacterium]|nr:aldehyde dehydrogenase [Bacteroidota bacterium]
MNTVPTISARKQSLQKLLSVIMKYEDDIIKALFADFKKPEFESVITETAYIISDIKDTLANIESYARPKRVRFNILNFPSGDYIIPEPYGRVLVIAPWNYPFQLAICPLVAAVAAGNRVVLKPSELTPHTAAMIAKIISESFADDHVSVEQGGQDKSTELLSQRWDYIFFTGSVAVGKIVAKAAAVHLTPVTLELGGKSPCIVDHTANILLTAKRLVWGKFINAGQTCIAPDYILVHHRVKADLIKELKNEITSAYGTDIKQSPDLARIINIKNWERLMSYIQADKVVFGGESNKDTLYISPTLIDEPGLKSDVMQNEIFGPILPIISYTEEKEIEEVIKSYEKPLSLYVFTNRRHFAEEVIHRFSFGGGCVNDTIMHISNKKLPFGGVGHSGMGAYHGKAGFDTFSHKKSVSKKGTWLDVPLRYAPYKNKLNTLRKLLKWI